MYGFLNDKKPDIFSIKDAFMFDGKINSMENFKVRFIFILQTFDFNPIFKLFNLNIHSIDMSAISPYLKVYFDDNFRPKYLMVFQIGNSM